MLYEVITIYKSTEAAYSNLIVVDKENNGKGDASYNFV